MQQAESDTNCVNQELKKKKKRGWMGAYGVFHMLVGQQVSVTETVCLHFGRYIY